MNCSINPKITVLIPTHNSKKIVLRTIDSVLKQTFKNIKVIIIDDCSSDGTYEHICKHVQNNSRVQVYRNEQNLGIGLIRKKLFDLVTTDFFFFMDDDDFLYPSALAKMLNEFIKDPDFDFVVSKSKFAIKFWNTYWTLPFMQQKYQTPNHPLEWYCNNWVYFWGVLFKTKFVKTQGDSLWFQGSRYEDSVPLCKLFSAARKIGFWNGYAVQYLRRKNSITSTNSVDNVVANFRALIDVYSELFAFQATKVVDIKWRQAMINGKYNDLVSTFCVHYSLFKKWNKMAFFYQKLEEVNQLRIKYNAKFLTKDKWLSKAFKIFYWHLFKRLQ